MARALRSEINVTPLVDIVLVLLIVFIVMVPVLTREHPVALPMAGSGGAAPEPLVVTVLKEGGLRLQQENLGEEALVARLSEALARQEGQARKVFLKVDPDQPFQRTVNALDLIRRASDRCKGQDDADAVVAISVQKTGPES